MDGIDQKINSCESAGQEGTPLPVIVLRDDTHTKQMNKKKIFTILQNMHMVTCMYCHLSTQVEVAQEDGGLRAGDDQDDEDQEEKSKHIVHLMRPATSMIYIGL